MRIILGAAVAVVLGLACAGCGDSGVSGAKAAEAAPAPDPITATGCPKAPKPECVTLSSDGQTWDVTAAGVDMSRGVAVQITGTPGPAGACGATLTGAQVEYTGLRCAR